MENAASVLKLWGIVQSAQTIVIARFAGLSTFNPKATVSVAISRFPTVTNVPQMDFSALLAQLDFTQTMGRARRAIQPFQTAHNAFQAQSAQNA